MPSYIYSNDQLNNGVRRKQGVHLVQKSHKREIKTFQKSKSQETFNVGQFIIFQD